MTPSIRRKLEALAERKVEVERLLAESGQVLAAVVDQTHSDARHMEPAHFGHDEVAEVSEVGIVCLVVNRQMVHTLLSRFQDKMICGRRLYRLAAGQHRQVIAINP